MDPSTIAAIATPPGSAGIGIIKISGPDAVSITSAIFFKKAKNTALPAGSAFDNPAVLESHRLYLGHIIDPETGRTLDEVLLSVMRAPRSYTGEDVAEINTHSGMTVLRAIMDLVLRKGARLAEPGEFTKRAFLNGRIDLTQAEAVIDIINARTEEALDIAAAHIKGEFKECIRSARNALLNVMTLMEASIDANSRTSVTPAGGVHSSVDAFTQCAAAPAMRRLLAPGGTVLTSLTPETTKTTLPSAMRIC